MSEPRRTDTAEQIADWAAGKKTADVMTSSNGAAVDSRTDSMTAGPRGPIVLQDFTLIDDLAHFDRERIPERVVHAKGAGAFGYFEVTHDISKYTRAAVFNGVGKRTPVAFRGSTVGGESGSSDLARDPRGFAVKFYDQENGAVLDIVGNNTPIFFIRDPLLFPSFIHTQKRNPATHLPDKDMFWDFVSLRPESLHQMSFLFSDRGIPDGYRHMNGYGSHTFKLVNARGEPVYCKFHFKTDQGIKNVAPADAAGGNPDHAIQDLYEAIARGDFPSWTAYLQVMTFEEAERWRFNPFDLTKVWPHKEFPLIPFGRLVLNRNPTNYFAEVEQLAFSPSHLVPGIEPSPDKMLQARLFSYPDTHRHRLGPNYMQIPVNCPLGHRARTYQRDGPMNVLHAGGMPNYFPNSFSGPRADERAKWHAAPVTGDVTRYNTQDDDNFTQVGTFYRETLNAEERARLAENLGTHLAGAQAFIRARVIRNISMADAEYAMAVEEVVKRTLAEQARL